MIIARITSGLGNQLFQYAAGLALARARETELRLDLDWFCEDRKRAPHEQIALESYVPHWQTASAWNLCQVRGRPRTWDERAGVALRRMALGVGGRAAAYRPLRYATDGDFSFNPAFFELPADTYLDGNWQSQKYFAPVAAEMAKLLAGFAPSAAVQRLAAQIPPERSAFLHVRRSDYVSDPHFADEIGAVGADYYSRALRALEDQAGACVIFAFTDDADWCRANIAPLTAGRIIGPAEVSHPAEVLFLMRCCNHAIMANSSLSWWGAWREHETARYVCAPAPWFANSWRNARDLLPEGWRQLPR